MKLSSHIGFICLIHSLFPYKRSGSASFSAVVNILKRSFGLWYLAHADEGLQPEVF